VCLAFYIELVNNVDLTISHLLDGTIMYTPLDQQEQVNETKNMQQRKDDLTQKVLFVGPLFKVLVSPSHISFLTKKILQLVRWL